MAQQLHPQQDDRQDADSPAPGTEVRIPTQSRGSESAGVAARPFAHGSADVMVPAPRSAPGGTLAPERMPTPTPSPTRPSTPTRRDRNRTTVLVVVAVLAVMLLLCGLYAASAVRGRSPLVASPAPVPGLHDVTYTVTTAHGSPVVVTYSESTSSGAYSSGSATGVPSPWRLGTRVNESYGPSLAATIVPAGTDGEADDTVTCTIAEGGRTLAQMTRSGPGASVSCVP